MKKYFKAFFMAFMLALIIYIIIKVLNEFVLTPMFQISEFLKGWICGGAFMVMFYLFYGADFSKTKNF